VDPAVLGHLMLLSAKRHLRAARASLPADAFLPSRNSCIILNTKRPHRPQLPAHRSHQESKLPGRALGRVHLAPRHVNMYCWSELIMTPMGRSRCTWSSANSVTCTRSTRRRAGPSWLSTDPHTDAGLQGLLYIRWWKRLWRLRYSVRESRVRNGRQSVFLALAQGELGRPLRR